MRFVVIMMTLLVIVFSIHPASAKTHNRFALVDTGYDVCMLSKMKNCEKNQNLLFRSASFGSNHSFDVKKFRANVLAYLMLFNKTFATKAKLPTSEKELENYRIVIINLIYDYNKRDKPFERNELHNEFLHSGQVTSGQLPQQHKMYGLRTPFNPNHYAFEWWPMTLANVKNNHPQFIPLTLNTLNPQGYQALNFTYLISGTSFAGVREVGAKDILTLLKSHPKDGHPLLISFHCIAGKDRTGAVSTAYILKFGGYPYYMQAKRERLSSRIKPTSLSQALTYTTIDQQPANKKSVLLSQAYCLYLKKTANTGLICQ